MSTHKVNDIYTNTTEVCADARLYCPTPKITQPQGSQNMLQSQGHGWLQPSRI